MLRKLGLIFIFVIPALSISQLDVQAERGPKFRHADRNKDGAVDKRERQMEKTWEQKQQKLKDEGVDLNGDGIITPQERRLSCGTRIAMLTAPWRKNTTRMVMAGFNPMRRKNS